MKKTIQAIILTILILCGIFFLPYYYGKLVLLITGEKIVEGNNIFYFLTWLLGFVSGMGTGFIIYCIVELYRFVKEELK